MYFLIFPTQWSHQMIARFNYSKQSRRSTGWKFVFLIPLTVCRKPRLCSLAPQWTFDLHVCLDCGWTASTSCVCFPAVLAGLSPSGFSLQNKRPWTLLFPSLRLILPLHDKYPQAPPTLVKAPPTSLVSFKILTVLPKLGVLRLNTIDISYVNTWKTIHLNSLTL